MNRPKTQIGELRFPSHGGELPACPTGVTDIIDFSVSINPLGIPSCVAPLMERLVNDLGNYPDSESTELKQRLADSLSININAITVTNGSTELIYFLPSLWKQNRSMLCVSPCFSEYARAFHLAGIPVHEWHLSPESSFGIDMPAFLRKLDLIRDLGGIIIGHPNNPTGTLWGMDSLIHLLEYCEKRDLYLVVDETFIDFAGWEHSLLMQVEQSRNLILVQSLTKFYALPGLRLGYGITSPAVTNGIKAFRPPWSVNTLAQRIGIAVLDDTEFKKNSRQYIGQERDYLHKALTAIRSIQVFPSRVNFLLFRLRDEGAQAPVQLYQSLLQDGILIRNCGNFKGLDSGFFRVAVKKRTENDFLISMLNKHLE